MAGDEQTSGDSHPDGQATGLERDVKDALSALAKRPRDVEGERILAKLRRNLAKADAPPPRVARFEVIGTLGAGAMGTVYRARDPELQRELAVKVLHDAARDPAAALREARALAQLSHPNAVTVYDVGEDRGAIFVAMELVRGQNLRDWLAAAERSPREIVDVLVDAGRGLGAAHERGLVHGDFKPDNVLVGDDRVRVADFGLARLRGLDGPKSGKQAGPAGDGLARTTFAGTPAYMAPEQLDGERATAASDQFSFAATLFEALTGQRPYAASGDRETTLESLRAAQREGKVGVEASERIAPRPRRIVLRALASDPEQRYPDIGSLVAELDHRPGRRRVGIALAMVAFVAGLALGLFAYFQGRGDPCAGADARVTRVWSESHAAVVSAAFVTTGVSRAAQSFGETKRAVERYTRSWKQVYRQTCVATRVRGEQSDTLLDTRMRCLTRRLDRLAAVSRLLAKVRSGSELIGARTAIDALPRPATCLAAKELVVAEEAQPADPGSRQRVVALAARLDRGWALYALGRYKDALALAKRIERELSGIAFPLARARALVFVGAVHGRAAGPGQAAKRLQAALAAASAARADRLVFEIWPRLLKDALFAGKHQRVVEWSHFAKAAAARAGASAAVVDAIVGEAQLLAGRQKLARALLGKAVKALIADKAPGKTVAIVLSNLGNVQLQLGKVGAAESSYRQALARAKAQLGADHPTLARYIDKLGRIARRKGKLGLALRHHRRALAMREAAFGKDDRAVASSLLALGRALIVSGKLADARRHLARALAIRQRAYGKKHLRLAAILQIQGEVAYRAKRGKEAKSFEQRRSRRLRQRRRSRRFWQRALEIREKHSPAHRAVGQLRCLLGPARPELDALVHCRSRKRAR